MNNNFVYQANLKKKKILIYRDLRSDKKNHLIGGVGGGVMGSKIFIFPIIYASDCLTFCFS